MHTISRERAALTLNLPPILNFLLLSCCGILALAQHTYKLEKIRVCYISLNQQLQHAARRDIVVSLLTLTSALLLLEAL